MIYKYKVAQSYNRATGIEIYTEELHVEKYDIKPTSKKKFRKQVKLIIG